MTDNAFANVIAADLRATERLLDQTLAQAGTLLANMTGGRAGAGFASAAGHPALISLGEAIHGAITVRSRIIQTHDRLAKEADALGVSWTLGGPTETKPPLGTEKTAGLTADDGLIRSN